MLPRLDVTCINRVALKIAGEPDTRSPPPSRRDRRAYGCGESSNRARRPTELVKLNLRFPEALRRSLEREAKNKYRSLNTEIVARLYHSFQSQDETDQAARALISALDGAVLDRMLEIIKKDEADMVAYDEWKERSR